MCNHIWKVLNELNEGLPVGIKQFEFCTQCGATRKIINKTDELKHISTTVRNYPTHTITLKPEQKAWLKDHREVNFSAIARNVLDELIKKNQA